MKSKKDSNQSLYLFVFISLKDGCRYVTILFELVM